MSEQNIVETDDTASATGPCDEIEAALLSIEGLAEAIYELSSDGVSKRRFSAIGSLAGHLLDEVKRAREMEQSNLHRHPGQA